MSGLDSLKTSGVITAIGSFFGMIGGYFSGFGVYDGAKVGGAIAMQVAAVTKAEELVDAGVDSAGRNVDALVGKTGDAIDKIKDVAAKAVQDVADVWSKLFLCGYAMQIALNGVNQSGMNYNLLCKTALESLNCLSISLTTFSLNIVAVACGGALAKKVYQIIK